MRALIASGADRYADPWHPFPHTSPLIANELRGNGFDVEIDDNVDRAMTRLDGVDLLIVNAGDPWRDDEHHEGPPPESLEGFTRALEGGIGILALHCAVSSMRDYPEWFPTIGGMWIPSLSYHPPADVAEITAVANDARLDIRTFRVFDERYCRIQRIGRSDVVAEHAGATGKEPTAWVRHVGPSRVAVDLLGHDERSYESAGRRTLLSDLALWAVGATAAESEGQR